MARTGLLFWLVLAIGVGGCTSGPPACSGAETQLVLKGLLENEARILAILVTRHTRLYHEEMFAAAPASIGLVQQMKYGEAFAAIEEKISQLPDEGLALLAKQAIVAAKSSNFEVSAISTTAENGKRSSCAVTVDFKLGLPSSEQLTQHLGGTGRIENYIQAFDAARQLRQQRKYDVYFTDAGETVVELFSPE